MTPARYAPAMALAMVSLAAGQTAIPPGLVTAHAIVETAAAAPGAALTAEDFEIVDSGTPRPIEYFSAEPVPLTLVVLVDVSRSVTDTLRSTRGPSASIDLKPSLATLVSQLKDGDRIRLGRIGAKISLGSFLAGDAKARSRAIELVVNAPDQERGGPSPVWDAIGAAVTSLEKEPGRRAVVVITDGMATGNRLSLADVAYRAASANVSVSAIGFEAPVTIRQSRTTVITVKPEVLLQGIADYTGGVYRTPGLVTPADAAADPFESILPALRQCYTLGFHGEADGKAHPIEIRVKRPGLTVRARKAYVVR
jgi:Ca-activated chloride channel homolog